MPSTRPIELLGIPGAEIKKQRLAKEKAQEEVKYLRGLIEEAAEIMELIESSWTDGNLGGAVSRATAFVPVLREALPKKRKK